MTPASTMGMLRPHPLPLRTGKRASLRIGTITGLIFIALHAPLGLALKLVPHLATCHALLALGIALGLVVKRCPPGWVAMSCAYLVGSETLWRMTNASVFWEFGKYALLLVIGTALCLQRQKIRSHLPIVYLALLVPGALLTMMNSGNLGNLRQTLSFELSGPVTYAVCCLYLIGRNLSREDVLRCLTAMIAPVVAIAALTLLGLHTTSIHFGASSNADASGGFGPNQVSTVLGLGMVGCFLSLASKQGSLVWKAMMFALIAWFGIQSAMTLSRSGLYFSVMAMLAGTAFLVSDVRRFATVLVFGIALAGLGKFVIVPQLDAYTNGALETRFADTHLSGRDDLMKGDLLVFLQNPMLGVGVGMSREARLKAIGMSYKSHTEFTRLLSEHGLLGAAAISLILVMSVRSVLLQAPGWPRAFSTALVVFALAFMFGSGMRLAIPAFLLAFAGIRFVQPNASPGNDSKKVQTNENITRRRIRGHIGSPSSALVYRPLKSTR